MFFLFKILSLCAFHHTFSMVMFSTDVLCSFVFAYRTLLTFLSTVSPWPGPSCRNNLVYRGRWHPQLSHLMCAYEVGLIGLKSKVWTTYQWALCCLSSSSGEFLPCVSSSPSAGTHLENKQGFLISNAFYKGSLSDHKSKTQREDPTETFVTSSLLIMYLQTGVMEG